MKPKPNESYFLIDLMGGGVLIAAHHTHSLLKSPLERPVPAAASSIMLHDDSVMAARGEFTGRGYLRLPTAQSPLAILQMPLLAFPFLGGQ